RDFHVTGVQTCALPISRFYHLLDEFEKLTGCPLSVNTSFNVRGEPIVGSPEDAYRCFMRTEMDYLVLENALLYKKDQPKWDDKRSEERRVGKEGRNGGG